MQLIRSAVLAFALAVGAVSVPATADSAAILDQSAPVLSADQVHASNILDWPMQEFTPSKSGVLTRLDLALGRDSERVTSFHVDIFPIDHDGQPQSNPVYGNPDDLDPVQILATSVFEGSPSSADYRWTTINLERPVVLVGGQSYLIRPVPEDGDGNITWYTSSSDYDRGGARYDDGGIIYADDSETTHLQYGFKTWMTPSVFAQSGTWQAGSIDRSNEFDCVGNSGYCPTFKNLSTNADGSRVFGVASSFAFTLHSSDSGLAYSTSDTSSPLSNGGLYGTAMYSSANVEGVLLARFCNLWNSVDGGVSFSRITAVDYGRGDNACFKQVAATQDGQVMAAVASGATYYDKHQGVYVSTDAGITWAETIYDQSWTSIAINGDGSKMIMASDDGFVRFSSDFGATWNYVVIGLNNAGRFNSVAMTLDGGTAFLSDSHRLFKLNTSTGDVYNFGHEDLWTKIQVSSDGMMIAALDDSGSIFVSRDGGQTIGQAGSQGIQFTDLALAYDGSVIHASSAGQMYRIDPSSVDSTITTSDSTPGPKPTEKSSIKKIKNPPIQFVSGATILSKAAKAGIKKSVKKAGTNANYVITGSAGAMAGVPNDFVKALAKKRAGVVKAYLVKLGVKKSHIKIKVKIVKSGITPKTKILIRYSIM